MDMITLLQVTHVEQRLARELAATHNQAVRARRDQDAGVGRRLLARLTDRRPAVTTAACATC